MDFEEIFGLIRSSIATDWCSVPIGRDRASGSVTDWTHEPTGFVPVMHDYRAVYRADVSLSLEWGIGTAEEKDLSWAREAFPWHIREEETPFSLRRVDVLWNGQAVDSMDYYTNHSHGALFPAPERGRDGDRFISAYDLKLAELIAYIPDDRASDAPLVTDAVDRLGLRRVDGNPTRIMY